MRKSFLKHFCFVVFIFFNFQCFAVSGNGIKTLPNGDQIAYDGEYYDFKAADGVKMIKMWVPPHTSPIRGMFISGHGGGSGDSRDFARDENIRAFAMRLGFAVVGLHNFPGRQVYDDGAPVFFKALEAFANLGHHPEIKNIPFVIYGSSNGGATTYGFVNYAPEKAICFLANVSAGYNPEVPVDAALKVPGIFIIGKFDALIGERGIERTEKLISYARANGALWTWALELKGHEDGAAFDVYMKLVEQTVIARYPEKFNPVKKPVKLIELKEADGWLADLNTWNSGFTKVAPFSTYSGDKTKAGWLLNENMAFVYRSMATHHNQVELSVREFDRTYNPHTDPGTMFSLGGPVVKPGEKITIQSSLNGFPEWEKITVFNGADRLGEIIRGTNESITINIKPENSVYCLTSIAETEDGVKKTNTPLHFFVRDTTKTWKREFTHDKYAEGKTYGEMNNNTENNNASVNPVDSVLIAYALTKEMENSFSVTDQKISAFWKHIDDDKDYISLNPRANAPDDAQFNFVLTHDCKMTVKAAYGTKGIYLLYEIMDDNDVAWPNRFVNTENEMFYLNFDAVDVIMDSRSVASIADEANKHMFLTPSFALTTTSKQYQVACGTEEERPTGFKRTIPDPWDFNDTYITFEFADNYFGVEIELLKTDYFYKAQEWFIPWSEYGGGLKQVPQIGTRLGFSPGYNDRDEGEHFPPGVTSSGGSVNASNQLKWIAKSNPWGHSFKRSEPPYGWGEIEIGPMLIKN